MKKVAVVFANGTEEIEGITPVDVLRRAGVACDIISVSGSEVKGSHGITVKADKLSNELNMDDYDAIVIPGGMPGAVNIFNDKFVKTALLKADKDKKLIAAICASPAVVIAGRGLINGRKATCYPAPDFINALGDCYTGESVQVDDNLITANGPKSAMEFALAICKALNVQAKF